MIESRYPLVPMLDLVELVRRPVEVKPDQQYMEIGTYSYGRGIFHKAPRSGLEVGDKRLFVMKSGDLILQIVFAWEGAIAVAGTADDGLYGSHRFLTYVVDAERCVPAYLWRYLVTPAGRAQLLRISPGSAGRNRTLNARRLNEVTIPLPPLAEQRRIVERVEALAAKVEEARRLRREAGQELASLLQAETLAILKNGTGLGWATRPFGDLVINLDGRRIPLSRSERERRPGLFRYYGASGVIDHVDAHIFDGEFLLIGEDGANLLLRTTPIAFKVTGQFWLNNHAHIVQPRPGVLLEYIEHQFRCIDLKPMVAGSAQPKLTQAALNRIPILLPPLPEQQRIVAYLDGLQGQVEAVKRLQGETAAELGALLPAVLARAFRGEL